VPRQIINLAGASVVKVIEMASADAPYVIAGSASNNEIVWLRWDSESESFDVAQRLSTFPVSPVAVDYVDMDGDGDRDLIVAGPEGVRWFEFDEKGFAEQCTRLQTLSNATWARPLFADLEILDASTLASRARFCSFGAVRVAASINSERIATLGHEDILRLWNLQGRQLAGVTLSSPSFFLQFCRDGDQLLVANNDDILVYDTPGLRLVRRLQGHQNTVDDIAFSHGNRIVASVSHDMTAKLWSLETGELLQNLAGHKSYVLCATFSPDDRLLATADSEGIVKIWDVQTGQELLELKDFTKKPLAIRFQSRTRLVVWGAFLEGSWTVGSLADQ
jgi:hypothetical protein